MAWLKEEIIDMLIKEEVVTRRDLQKAIISSRETGKPLLEVFTNMGLLDSETLIRLMSKGLGLPYMDISKLEVDEEVLGVIPMDMMKRYKIVPIAQVEGVITVAVVDPINVIALDNVKVHTGKQVTVCLTSDEAMDNFWSGNTETVESIEEDVSAADIEGVLQNIAEDDIEVVRDSSQAGEDSQDFENEAPVIRAVNKILAQGVEMKASDIFIEPFEKHMQVRYRVDGILRQVEAPPRAMHEAIISRIKVIGNLDISEHRIPQDGKVRLSIGGRAIDFRISIVPASYGEKACIRILDKGAVMLDLDGLGFSDETLDKIKACVTSPHGMFVVTGPTGSGKSTTLYSILRYIDSPYKNLITVEDPVEYQIRGINQVQVNPDVNLTFAAALRSILRQDPDIILIGEIRDFETMDIAIKAALTGHLVLSTLHTNTAPGAIVRMVNMGVEPFLITASVVGIMGQRLLRKLCDHCKSPYEMTEELAEELNLPKDFLGKTFYKPVGCKKCFGLGYKGRVNVAEIMVMSGRIKMLVAKGAEEPEIRAAAIEEGMKTMRQDGLRKAALGITSLEEVFRVTA